MFSNLETREFLKVLQTTLNDQRIKFRSFSLFTEPGFKASYPYKSFELGLNAGFAFQYYSKPFRLKENKEIYLTNPVSGNPVKPGWTGFRAGLSVFYNF